MNEQPKWEWGRKSPQEFLSPICYLMALYDQAHKHGEQVVLVFDNGRQELVEEVLPWELRLFSNGKQTTLGARELNHMRAEQFRLVAFARLPVALGGQCERPIDGPQVRAFGYMQASVTE